MATKGRDKEKFKLPRGLTVTNDFKAKFDLDTETDLPVLVDTENDAIC